MVPTWIILSCHFSLALDFKNNYDILVIDPSQENEEPMTIKKLEQKVEVLQSGIDR